jgi:uncharacterized protein DUF3592
VHVLGQLSSTLLLIGALAGANAVRLWRRANQATHWPAVGGVVTQSRVEARKFREGSTMYRTGSKSTHYRAEIAYAYDVGGRRFEGHRIRFGTRPGWDRVRSGVERVVSAYPTGMAVQVRYDPLRPDESVLESGLADFWNRIAWFAVGCLGLGLFGWVSG